MSKIYHIYAKEKCIYPNVSEEKFEDTWNQLNNIIEFIETDYHKKDLSFEELSVDERLFDDPSY
jgi:hemerythrin superfamily protein